MRPAFLGALAIAGAVCSSNGSQAQNIIWVDQGPKWTTAARSDFYDRDQGSQMIALSWLRALNQANGQPFLADKLSRYGYLENPDSSEGLPVGFTASGPAGSKLVGMTCAACHTRQVTEGGKTFRIDGGPAIVDFQTLLTDIDAAVARVLSSDQSFAAFAASVFGNAASDPADVTALRRNVEAWFLRYHTLMSNALPKNAGSAWGPARLDAVGMIFNRVAGLDLGPPPDLLIAENIKTADAPARYLFLWNAPKHDHTQWSGFAGNGSDILALARNLGQVLGVFAVFQPQKRGRLVDFLSVNSANFDGLSRLEDSVKKIGPPRWPWSVDPVLAKDGRKIFNRQSDAGGCVNCHTVRPGKFRYNFRRTWKTPIQNVGTDTRQFDILEWSVKTGTLQGAYVPLITQPLKQTDSALSVLATSVLGSIAEHVLAGTSARSPEVDTARTTELEFRPSQVTGYLPPELQDLKQAFPKQIDTDRSISVPHSEGLAPTLDLIRRQCDPDSGPVKGCYEARVLQGISGPRHPTYIMVLFRRLRTF